MAKSSFEEILNERGELIYTNVGDSMYPMIKPRDLLVIKKSDGCLNRLDIPLYKRDNGQYVLHRIVKKTADGYVMCGDNRYCLEYGITDRHIIGFLTEVIRDGRRISVYSIKNRLHAHLYCDLFFLRRKILKHKKHMEKNG